MTTTSLVNHLLTLASAAVRGGVEGLGGGEEEDEREASHSWASVEIVRDGAMEDGERPRPRRRRHHFLPGDRVRAKISIFARKRNWVHYGVYASLEGAVYYARNTTSISGASLFEALAASSGPGAYRLFEPLKVEVVPPHEYVPFGLTERFVEFVIPSYYFAMSGDGGDDDDDERVGRRGTGVMAPLPETLHGKCFQIRYAIVVKVKRAIHKGPLTASAEIFLRRESASVVAATTARPPDVVAQMEEERRQRQFQTFGLCEGVTVKLHSHREGVSTLTLRLNSPLRGRLILDARQQQSDRGDRVLSVDLRMVRVESVFVDEDLESVERIKLGDVRIFSNLVGSRVDDDERDGVPGALSHEFPFTYVPFPRLEVCPSVVDLQRVGGMSFSAEYQLSFEITLSRRRGRRGVQGEDVNDEGARRGEYDGEIYRLTRLVDVTLVR